MSTTHTYEPPSGGKDLPAFGLGLTLIPTLGGLGLDDGTVKITVTVTPHSISAPGGTKAWFGIFVNSGLEAVGQKGSGETLTLSEFGVQDTDLVTIKWRSASGVTNHLDEAGDVETIISYDYGTN